jgi:hypothetical protein
MQTYNKVRINQNPKNDSYLHHLIRLTWIVFSGIMPAVITKGIYIRNGMEILIMYIYIQKIYLLKSRQA